MSIDDSGLNGKISGRVMVITVENNHPLIQLAQGLNCHDLVEIIVPDLQSTTKKGRWWMGRRLRLRIHLGAYILQQLFNKADKSKQEMTQEGQSETNLFSNSLNSYSQMSRSDTPILSPSNRRKFSFSPIQPEEKSPMMEQKQEQRPSSHTGKS